MKFLIIGAGSMGCLLGAQLALGGHFITAYGSIKTYQSISKYGLIFQDLTKNRIVVPNFNLLDPSELKTDFGEFDYCIITCKVPSLEQVLNQYNEIIQKFSTIYLLQNGLGNEKMVLNHFPEMQVIRIITSNSAYLQEHHLLNQTGKGTSYFCMGNSVNSPQRMKNSKQFTDLLYILQSVSFPVAIAENPQKIIWEKAIINMAINPLGAVLDVANGILLNSLDFWKIAKILVEEILLIGKHLKIILQSSQYYLSNIRKVLEQTSLNRNSMLQDLDAFRQTEIDYLNGYIVEIATKFEVQVPVNTLLTSLIKMKEQK